MTDKPSATHSSRRVNKLCRALGAERYLEIGVFNGLTFLDVSCATKVGVDPAFRFDAAGVRDASTHLYETTSDRYFAGEGDVRGAFDVIFLDGLHEFKQTLRDLVATLALGHERTVWLIDDVYPTDPYSSWPNQKEAIAFRREAGGKGGNWHGDVFKLVYFVEEYMPSYSYHTIDTGGNRQLLMWREPRSGFTSSDRTLSSIEAMTYFDMRTAEESFRFADEDLAIDRAVTALRR